MRSFFAITSSAFVSLTPEIGDRLRGEGGIVALHDFTDQRIAKLPSGWIVTSLDFSAELVMEQGPNARQVLRLTADPVATSPVGNLASCRRAHAMRGSTIELTATIRAASPNALPQLWLRVDRPGQLPGGFDDMSMQAVSGDQWQFAKVRKYVDEDAELVAFGLMSTNRGTIECLGIELRVVI